MELVDQTVENVKNDGVSVIERHLSVESCDQYKRILNNNFKSRLAEGSLCGDNDNQVLDNYFMESPELLDLLELDLVDKIMRIMIDDDYVLIGPSARNRRRLPGKDFGGKTAGIGWHTDSRFLQGGVGLRPSLCYTAVICLDDFRRENGATHFIRKSHKRYARPENRDAELEYEILECPKGSLVIFDTALWHKSGHCNHQSRWGVFNMYGPWFMKPYFRYSEMFSKDQLESFSPLVRQLLHCDSTPPLNHNERLATLTRVGL